MPKIDEYAAAAGDTAIEELKTISAKLRNKTILNVNSTAVGGGVAEILSRMLPMMTELGIKPRWELIKGGEDFYAVTKKFHNALHGTPQKLTAADFQLYRDTLKTNMESVNLDADIALIHDPQPAGLIEKKPAGAKWIWRCHIDLSNRQRDVWDFLRGYVSRYDAAVISAPSFSQELPVKQFQVPPSIDPLADKNRELTDTEISDIMKRLEIPADKPLITQVSRFDRLKDPLGVIEAFKKIQPYVTARLLLVGGSADDDPEGAQVLAEARAAAEGTPDIIVLCLPPTSNVEINAIQRASSIILQKSLKEGFGLTVSEALWKAKPVIAGAVGGIPLQITHKYSGILTRTIEGTAYWMKRLLHEPAYARKLGENGREHVRQNFLLTRHLRDYLLLALYLESGGRDFIHL
ncbi:MAG: glycosyl transferase family 1 [Elusimicrobia bacterium GWA2_56_46]|nr:MAG: glycosyl transferase family 1 [Elusimicrobia bacterium GWA2_56_46]OGR55562.1 MAG: glycosyl transferase family 1 [Elusimicrobia bacterium GWC2_56_31]HBB67444.1 glycosyl transferase family 1 [Elusimicrobiota bacterium]HBW22035.1 glycosyl transferase family 1 [Elusimicrobiota bacterium]